MPTIRITADTSEAVRELSNLADLADSTKLPDEVLNRFLSLPNCGLEVSCVETLTAPLMGAEELRVGFKFSDRFREFVPTLRATKINDKAVEVPSHAGESITSG